LPACALVSATNDRGGSLAGEFVEAMGEMTYAVVKGDRRYTTTLPVECTDYVKLKIEAAVAPSEDQSELALELQRIEHSEAGVACFATLAAKAAAGDLILVSEVS
jgi:hypothetical protein